MASAIITSRVKVVTLFRKCPAPTEHDDVDDRTYNDQLGLDEAPQHQLETGISTSILAKVPVVTR
jgi:hypothetical protein